MSAHHNAKPVLVRDLMTVGVPTCSPETPIREIAKVFLERGLEAIVVLNKEGHADGIVTQDDLVRAYTQSNWEELKAEDILQTVVPQVLPDIPIITAAQIMQDRRVRVLYLTHHAGGIVYPAACITYWHILRHLSACSEEDLRDLGIYAERQLPMQAFIQKREAARNRKRATLK